MQNSIMENAKPNQTGFVQNMKTTYQDTYCKTDQDVGQRLPHRSVQHAGERIPHQVSNMQNSRQQQFSMDPISTGNKLTSSNLTTVTRTVGFNIVEDQSVTCEATFKGVPIVSNSPEYVKVSKTLEDKLNRPNNGDSALFYMKTSENLQRKEMPQIIRDTWNRPNYVRIPLNPNFKKTEAKSSKTVLKWTLISDELTKLYHICNDPKSRNREIILNIGYMIQNAIMQYNKRAIGTWNFDLLKQNYDLAAQLFNTMPIIIIQALRLQNRLANPIPLLKKGRNQTLYFSRSLVSSVIANFFLCTFPEQPSSSADIKDYNFIPMFNKSSNQHKMPGKIEKLKCILEYFNKIDREGDNDSIISYHRRCIPYPEDWAASQKQFCPVGISQGKIENSNNMLQVDFANKFVGGGVLNEGLVMEEIRFVICPELLAARLFTERLDDNEVLVITGIKQYSSYTGYGPSFKFMTMNNDNNKVQKDDIGRDTTQVVAMDAIHFTPGEEYKQYNKQSIDRELHKCRVAFDCKHVQFNQEIATGNWGCGAFNGNPELKFVIQWIAASHIGRPGLVYHTLGDKRWEAEIKEIYKVIRKHPVGNIYRNLLKYGKEMRVEKQTLFNFFKSTL